METKVRRFYFVNERFRSAIQYLFRFFLLLRVKLRINLFCGILKKEGGLMFLQAVTVQNSPRMSHVSLFFISVTGLKVRFQ